MDNYHNERHPPRSTLRNVTMVIFGNEVKPLKVHLIPQSSTDTVEEEEPMPPGLSEQEQAAFFRHSRALRPRTVSSKFNTKHPNNRSVPKVEPVFERRVFEEGTLITVTMRHVRREDVLVQVKDRTLVVTGLVRSSADSDDEEGGAYPVGPRKRRKTSLIYTYQTGVTEMMDLTSVIAGYRKGYVDLFLRRVYPQLDNQQDEGLMEDE